MKEQTLTEQELLDLKADVESAKINVAQYTGQLDALYKQLSDDWKCKTIGEADILIETMSAEIDSLIIKIEKGSADLQKLLNKIDK